MLNCPQLGKVYKMINKHNNNIISYIVPVRYCETLQNKQAFTFVNLRSPDKEITTMSVDNLMSVYDMELME